jgi:plastocyanin
MRPVFVVLVTTSLWVPPSGAQEGATLQGVVQWGPASGPKPVVYLLSADGSPLESGPERAVIDQRHLRFRPVVLVAAVGSTVEFLNSDPVMHNVFSPGAAGVGFDLGTYEQGDRREHTFRELGEHVILCHVHPEMVAYVVVVPTKHHATVDEEGRFELRDVPAGAYQLNVWHHRLPPSQRTVRLSPSTVTEVVVSLDPSGEA